MTRYVEDGYFGGQDEELLNPELYGRSEDQDSEQPSLSVVAACYAAVRGRTEDEFYRRVATYMRAYIIHNRPGRSFFVGGKLILELELPSTAEDLESDEWKIEKELESIVGAVNDGGALLGRKDGLYSITGSLLAALRTLGQLLEAAWWGDRLPVTTPSDTLNAWMNQAMDALEKLDGPNSKAFEHIRRMRLYDELADYTDHFNDEQHELMAELEETPLDQEIDFDAFLERIAAASDDRDQYGW